MRAKEMLEMNSGLSETLKESDEELYGLLKAESERQRNGLEMIASENFTSRAVLDCLGSCLTNKYSEGRPKARYYGGNEFIDLIEELCQKRTLEAFGLCESEWGVNVQPYSGSPANFAVYTGLLSPHDRLMGMHLPDGGHLTHGFMTNRKRISATSIFWESIPYFIDPVTELIDYDQLEKTAKIVRPKLIVAGFSCYSRFIDFERFRKICDSVGAILMADIAHVAGLIASNLYPSPFPYAHIVTSTTHKTLRGPRSGLIFYSKSPGPNKINFGEKINSAVFPGLQGGPHNNVIAAVATCMRQVSSSEFRNYSKQVVKNAKAMSDYFIKNGYIVATNGTDNHMILLNVMKSFNIDGAIAELILDIINISVNKNACAGDKSVLKPSGIRIGTPALTTRGFKESDIQKACGIIENALKLAQKISKSIHNLETSNTEMFKKLCSSAPYHDQIAYLKSCVESLASEFSMSAVN